MGEGLEAKQARSQARPQARPQAREGLEAKQARPQARPQAWPQAREGLRRSRRGRLLAERLGILLARGRRRLAQMHACHQPARG